MISKYTIPLVLGIIFSTGFGVEIKHFVSDRSIANIIYNIGLVALLVICLTIIISLGYTAPLYAGF